MKNIKIYIQQTLLLICISVIFYSCGKDDSEKAWGNTKIYMPQAAMLNGGLDNNYPVPFNNNPATNNYSIDTITNTLKVVLGVYRSGLQTLESFSVKVNADLDATNAILPSISKAVQLPADVYSLPTEVTVANGQRESIFYLTIDLNKLIANYPTYKKNKIVLVVGINNPSKYDLNEKLAETTVIIDGSKFIPDIWTPVNLVGTLPATYATVKNGILTFDYGTGLSVGEICFYNSIELKKDSKYKFSCGFNSTGGASITNARFYLAVSPVMPVAGTSYPYSTGSSFYTMMNALNGLKNQVNGTLPQNGSTQAGIDKTTGIFKSNFSGMGYIIIGVAATNSPIGKIIISDVKIEEQ